jgi:hypothetical protein
MSRARADIGFADALDEFNPADWSPATNPPPRPRLPAEETRRAAEATGFRSREVPELAAGGRAGEAAPLGATAVLIRRRRTGRNAQFNLKARPETIEAFCAVADLNGWGLGETLEKAVALLQREYLADSR